MKDDKNTIIGTCIPAEEIKTQIDPCEGQKVQLLDLHWSKQKNTSLPLK